MDQAVRALGTSKYLTQTAYLASCSSLAAVGGIFVILRLGASIKQAGRPYLDDYVMITGLLFLIATFVITNYLQAIFDGITNDLFEKFSSAPTDSIFQHIAEAFLVHAESINKGFLGLIVVSNLVIWLTKVPLLLLLIRLFHVKTWLRRASYTVIVVSLLAIIAVTAWSGHVCDIGSSYSSAKTVSCGKSNFDAAVAIGIIGLAMDVSIFILPIPVVIKLNLPRNKKAGVLAIFGTGISGIVVGIVGCYWRIRVLSTQSFGERQITSLCVVLEGIIAIFVGCIPGYYFLWRTIVAKTGLTKKSQSTATNVSSRTLPSKPRNFRSGPSTGSRSDTYSRNGADLEMDTPPETRGDSASLDPELGVPTETTLQEHK